MKTTLQPFVELLNKMQSLSDVKPYNHAFGVCFHGLIQCTHKLLTLNTADFNTLKIMSYQVCDIDSANKKQHAKPEITILCGQMHEEIIRLLGNKSHLVYAPDDGSEYDPRN